MLNYNHQIFTIRPIKEDRDMKRLIVVTALLLFVVSICTFSTGCTAAAVLGAIEGMVAGTIKDEVFKIGQDGKAKQPPKKEKGWEPGDP